VQIHVPNTAALATSFLNSSVDEKWRLMGSLLGMYCDASVRSPDELVTRSDHQILFDEELLRWALDSAGFTEITDLTGSVEDVHTLGWQDVVANYSLVFRGAKPRA
jgi:hypothetical protein